MRLRRQLLASTAGVLPRAFFNTNSGSKIYICATPQPADLTLNQFAALAWVEIKGVGNMGETGNKTNMLNYPTWGDAVVQKAKGLVDAGSPTLEVARVPTDQGQTILRNAAQTNFNYAIMIVRNDASSANGTGTVRYNRGLIDGPTEPNGRNEDFDLEVFTFGFVQKQITTDPTAPGNAPAETAAPAITGTAKVNNVLTVSNGTFTGDATITYAYQWLRAGSPIQGATANQYIATSADIGSVLTAIVTATNNSGSASGTAAPTAAVIA